MSKYFFFGQARPDPSSHRHISVGPDYRVEGGTKDEHKQAREITQKFAEGVKQDGVHHAPEILRDVVKKVCGT